MTFCDHCNSYIPRVSVIRDSMTYCEYCFESLE